VFECRLLLNIVLQLSDNETVKNATNALTKKHPDNSYIAKIDDNGKLTVYDLNGNT
jgi:myo-inositol-hexaphosphate 3-phosphohydrolase